jgi:hypothetical protein
LLLSRRHYFPFHITPFRHYAFGHAAMPLFAASHFAIITAFFLSLRRFLSFFD